MGISVAAMILWSHNLCISVQLSGLYLLLLRL